MRTIVKWLPLLAAVGGLAGCAEPLGGTSRPLGDVDYPSAFAVARDVLGQYFSIESADADKGLIRSRPKPLREKPDRLISGSSPARESATVRLRRQEGQIVAQVAVLVERQGTETLRRFGSSQENYDSVPKQTPAEVDAATTPEQNEVWTVERHDTELERRILEDLYFRLHPGPLTQPAK